MDARTGRSLWLLGLVVLVPACGGGGGSGGGAAAVPFVVTSATPAHLSLNVPRQPVIYLRFSRALNPATLAGNITLAGAGPVALNTLDYVPALMEVRITPAAGLAASQSHTLTVTNGVQDASGNAFSGGLLTFNTNAGDDVRPDFTGGSVAAGTATLTQIPLTWTASSDTSAVYDIFLSLVSGLFDFKAGPYQTAPGSSTGHTLTGLASDTTYYLVVRPRDTDGNVNLNTVQVVKKTLTSWSLDVYPIVQSNCRSCHTGSGDGASQVTDMDMSTAANLYADWYDVDPFCTGGTIPVGAKRIKPGGGAAARDASFVWNKIKSKFDGVAPWCGVGMPQTGGALNDAELATFENWILEGAAQN